jgi:hypothetical protein
MWDTQSQQGAIRKPFPSPEKNTIVSFDLADPFAVGRYREPFLSLIKEAATSYLQTGGGTLPVRQLRPYEAAARWKALPNRHRKEREKGSYICHDGVKTAIPVKGPEYR